MEKGTDYRITKLEKGPLQRFKNQNLILKRFGETGLQVYKAITGKRTAEELRGDLGVEQSLFSQILDFMHDAGMVELESVKAHEPESGIDTPADIQPAPAQEKPGRTLEELPQEESVEEAKPPLEEQHRKRRKAAEEEAPEPPQEEISMMGGEAMKLAPEQERAEPETAPSRKKKGPAMEFEEITPIEFEPEKPAKKKLQKVKPPAEEAAPEEAIEPETSSEEEPEQTPAAQESGPPPEENEPSAEAGEPSGEEEIKPEETDEKIKPVSDEEAREGTSYGEKAPEESAGLSPVEKIISDKYGDIGLRVYTLIDGQRTAEEIMRDTGLTEAKLVEILDFMDEQGIIKLDYPKGQAPAAEAASPATADDKKEAGFVPMIEGDKAEEVGPVPSPLEIPMKAPVDIVKSVQMKARVMLKYGDRGSRLFSQIDGKNDLIDLSTSLGVPLYTVSEVLRFMMENGMVIMKPLARTDVRKKYGDDGYSVYKRYGKEGLMFYELIGKNLTIRQMADQVTTDKSKIVDMFIFIHKVLGIELPIERDALAKQLGM
jgi:hypothetical protein